MISFVLTWATIVGAIITFFDAMERTATVQSKDIARSWLLDRELPSSSETWQAHIPALFDSLYGPRTFSKKFFLRSMLSTFLCLSTVMLLFAINANPYESDGNGGSNLWKSFEPNFIDYSTLLLFTFISLFLTNIIPDYFSLIQTRMVIDQLSQYRGFFATAFFIIYDFVCTGVIFLTFALFVLVFFFSSETGQNLYQFYTVTDQDYSREEVAAVFQDSGFLIGFIVGPMLGALSTYVTSIWLWIHAIVGLLFKLIFSVSAHFVRFRNFLLNVSEKPFLSIGIMASVMFSFVYVLIGIL